MSAELQVLREQVWFKRFLQEMVKEAPPIPMYDPSDPASVEKWKAASWNRQGYFNALSRFGFSLDDLKGDV